ncbi:MAG TPA: hypothetical protein VF230_13850 [Acidimicrobiales bacterium]
MTAQNRVMPTGEIAASPLRCRWMGNRGCLHAPSTEARRAREVRRAYALRRWITCETNFRGRRALQWAPGRYTVLFLYDDAVAFAAGHRPCAQCRYRDYRAYMDCWAVANGGPAKADDVDVRLHADRLADDGRQRTHRRAWRDLPDGTFVLAPDGRPARVERDALRAWANELGYADDPVPRPTAGDATVLTPAATVDVLVAGYPLDQVDH